MNHFELIFLGWSGWFVIPLACVIGFAIAKFSQKELSTLPGKTRKWLTYLRAAAAVLLVLMLLEPALRKTSTQYIQPKVMILMDQSGSMGLHDADMHSHHKLNEAIALGLLDAKFRNNIFSDAHSDIEWMSKHISQFERLHEIADRKARVEFAKTMQSIHDSLLAHAEKLVLYPKSAIQFRNLAILASDIAHWLNPQDKLRPQKNIEALIAEVRKIPDIVKEVSPSLTVLQKSADASLAAAADDDSPIKKAIALLSELSRNKRAEQLIRKKLIPKLQHKGKPEWVTLTSVFEPYNPEQIPSGHTDFASPLTALARCAAAEEQPIGAIVLVSDGRQTYGSEPTSALRALAAREIRFYGITIGNPDQPNDAVIAEVSGTSEVYKNETIRLDVRFRITGFTDTSWNLTLSSYGEIMDNRIIRGTGAWQQERFEFKADKAGLHIYQVRLSAIGRENIYSGHQGTLLREIWEDIPGHEVRHLTDSHKYKQNTPDLIDHVQSAETPINRGDFYGQRLRGYILPPQTGMYQFEISADDTGELWLGANASPDSKTLIASCRSWVPRDVWNQYPSQQSEPIALVEGERYYIEILHKENQGNDHVSVGWILPDLKIERPIPGGYLEPWDDGVTPANQSNKIVEASLDNNQAQFVVSVTEKQIRILLVDAYPRWESRYLAAMFDRDKRIQLDRRYHAIPTSYPNSKSLFPETQGEIDQYDIIIIGDLLPEELGTDTPRRLAQFVNVRGGFLIFLAGSRAMPKNYLLGSISDILPVRVQSKSDTMQYTGRNVRLAYNNIHDPITAILQDTDLNRQLWSSLTPLKWVEIGVIAKSDAKVLLETADEDKTLVLVTAQSGAGRVLYFGTDESWRWRDRLGDHIHKSFWMQAIRWGLLVQFHGKDPRLQVSMNKLFMRPDETAELLVRAILEDGTVPNEGLVLEISTLNEDGLTVGKTEMLTLSPIVDSHGLFKQSIGRLPVGRYQIKIRCKDPAFAGLEEIREFVIQDNENREWLDLNSDHAALERFVAAGGGIAGDVVSADDVFNHLAERLTISERHIHETISLWNGYIVILVIITLLAAEWIWRKRVGLP